MPTHDLKLIPRRSQDRGNADYGWLKTFHTFSFDTYQDRDHQHFGCLRVLNEDHVQSHTGFGTHSYKEFEIFSYVVSGELELKDSMGNIEILKRGDVQLTSAGTGISHYEKAHGSQTAHFLQIWSIPSISHLAPKCYTRHFPDADKKDTWIRVVAPLGSDGVSNGKEGDGPAPVQSPLKLFASLISPGKTLDLLLGGSKAYVHVIQTSGCNNDKPEGASVKVAGKSRCEEVTLREGDGAYVSVGRSGNALVVENNGDREAEVLVFDIE